MASEAIQNNKESVSSCISNCRFYGEGFQKSTPNYCLTFQRLLEAVASEAIQNNEESLSSCILNCRFLGIQILKITTFCFLEAVIWPQSLRTKLQSSQAISIMYKMMYTNVYVHDSKCRFLHKIIQRPQAMILYEKT